MPNDAKGHLKSRIGPWLHFLIYYRPRINDSMGILGGRHLQAALMWAEPLGQGCTQHGASHQDTVRLYRLEKAWRIFWKDSPIPYRKENLERFLHVLWQDITTERMSPLGRRGGLKAFRSRTVTLHVIAGFFQRAQADRARHTFQRESSTLKSQKRNQPGARQGNAGNTILFDRAVH